MNRFYLVRNTVGSGGGTEVDSSSIPPTSPNLHNGTPTTGGYKLFKVPEGAQAPTGASVTELTREEAALVTQSGLFGGEPTIDFVKMEQQVSSDIRCAFMAAQSSLSSEDADNLFGALEATSHALSAGSLKVAYRRFNLAPVDQQIKDAYNPLFEDYFVKFPRDLT